jgi:hypothetical protein
VLSVAESLFGDFSVLASDFFELLLVASLWVDSVFVDSSVAVSALLFFFVLFDEGLVALSDAGLLAVEGFEAESLAAGFEGEDVAGLIGVGFGVTMAAAVPLGLGAAETAVAAVGAAVALVDALAFVVVAPLVLVFVTPTLKLGVTPKYP